MMFLRLLFRIGKTIQGPILQTISILYKKRKASLKSHEASNQMKTLTETLIELFKTNENLEIVSSNINFKNFKLII